jgi:hypothetical protein
MPGSLDQQILDHLEASGDDGLAMGALVDAFADRGEEVDTVEASIWRLLELRRMTPHGYIRRVLRSPGSKGESRTRHCYELILRPWSPELDAQLDLALDPTA